MKKYRLSSLLVSLLLLGATELLAADQGSNAGCDHFLGADGVRPGRMAVRHIEGGGIGYDKGYTSLDLFFAAPAGNFLPFVDLRGHVFNDAKLAFNGGVGTRYLGGRRIYGAGVYYDYRQASLLKRANQLGVSLESLGTCWDFRLNGYFPFGKTKTGATNSGADPRFAYFAGHQMFVNTTQQFAMSGANGEVGVHLGTIKDFHFYSAVGPYYFNGRRQDAYGAKGRIYGSYKEYIKLELSDSYDTVFHNKFQGQLTFSVPFGAKGKVKHGGGCSDSAALRGLLAQPVIREEIIVEDSQAFTSLAMNPETGLPFYFTFMDNTSHSDGTFESPYHDLSDALANSSEYGVIYVYPGDGTNAGLNGGNYSLQSYQQLLGAATQQPVVTTLGTIVIPALAAQMPQLEAIAGTSIVHIANHTVISGLYFAVQGAASPTPGNPTYAIGVREGVIDSLTVSNCEFAVRAQAVGIFVNPSETDARQAFIGGTVILSGNRIASPDFTGSLGAILQCRNGALASTISNNTIAGFQGTKITADVDGPTGLLMLVNGSSVASIAVSGNQVRQNKNGLFLDHRDRATGIYTVSGNTFEDNLGVGAIIGNGQFESSTVGVVFTGNSASFNGGDGVKIAGSGVVSVVATANQCIANGGHGMHIVSGYLNSSFAAVIAKNTANYNTNGSGINVVWENQQPHEYQQCAVTANTANYNSNNGISFTSNSLGAARFVAAGNTAMQNQNNGISVEGSSPGDAILAVTLTGNTIEDNAFSSMNLLLSCPIRLVAERNKATGAKRYDGIGLILSSHSPSSALISSNTFQNNVESGAYIDAPYGSLDLNFSGNSISTATISPTNGGLYFFSPGPNLTATVTGNTFTGHGTGVDLQSTGNVCLEFASNTTTCTPPYVFANNGSGYYNITPEPLNNNPPIPNPIAGVTRNGDCP